MNRYRIQTIALSALLLGAAGIAACSGGGGGQPTLPGPGNPGQSASSAIVLTIPNQGGIGPNYISASTTSMSVKINGGAATSYPLTPGSPGCVGNPLTCTVPIDAPVGNDTFAITLFNSTNQALSTNTVSATIIAGQANNINITFNGVIASIALGITGSAVTGTPATLPITLTAKDAGGNTIIGPGVFTVAIVLGDADGSGHTHLLAGGVNKGLSYTVPDSTSEANLALAYDGGVMGSAATISAAAGAIHATPVLFQPSPGPSPSPTPTPTPGPPVANPTTLAFLAVGAPNNQTFNVNEVGFSGTFIESDNCGGATPIASVSPTSASGPSATFTVTPDNAGSCTVNVTSPFGVAHVAVTVTTTIVHGQ